MGSNLVDYLLTKGKTVSVLDNLSRIGSEDNLSWLRSRHGESWRFVQGDIRDPEAVATVVRESKPDVIAHLAGQVAMTTSVEDPRLDFEVNTMGTFNVLEAVRLHSPSTILLYSSTNKVYGSLDQLRYEELETRYQLLDYPDGLDESLPLDGYSPYGCSKLVAEQYVRDYQRIYGIPTVVFRHSTMYGGRQFATYDQGWIGWFCMKAVEMAAPDAPPFTISGDGKQVRDVLYADDLVSVYIEAVEHIDTTAGQIYNIGGGYDNSLSLLELFALLEELTAVKMRYSHLDWRAGDQKVFIADTSKAEKEFGWSPTISGKEGIGRMVQWSRQIKSQF